MFKSKILPIVIPQYEHGRMAGILASYWGNADFHRPAIDFNAWVAGVAFHDWHYGLLDNLPIGEADEETWLSVTRQAVELTLDDPTTDVVVKLHIRRLLGGDDSAYPELVRQVDERVRASLSATSYSLADFRWADSITRLCDNIAFDFGFGTARTEPSYLSASHGETEETSIHYQFQSDGTILVDPWPFAVPSFAGVVTAFAATGYPERLQPRLLPFLVMPMDG